MKFMKLGSKPDAFLSDGNFIRYASSELANDVVINVGEIKFFLHKFPLLSKSSRLQKVVQNAQEENFEEIELVNFPGGPKAFEICAKFCYGMTVTLNAYNVVAARCAAEYMEMTEDVEKGNLIFKIEVFLNSSIFRSWKDSIIVLQTSKSLQPMSEELKVIGRCVDSISSRTSVDPTNVTWSYTYNRKLAARNKLVERSAKLQDRVESVPKDWWVEDICELEIDLYKRVMIAIKSKGRMDSNVIGEAVKTYAVRWLPDSVDALVSENHAWRNRALVETIICLLPSDRGLGCSCSFLLKLLKVAILVEADDSVREDLVNKISVKLDEASVDDLLIPARSSQTSAYDVELVQSIVNRYIKHEAPSQHLDIVDKNENRRATDFVLGHGSLLKVGKVIDGYLAEIAHDPNLALSRFIDLSLLIPESARPIHDGLYMAVDVFLKEHPDLTKAERKKICSLMDVKKLTPQASIHAAQNDRLPLRVVVQVLFFEQVRSASGAQPHSDISQSTINTTDDECEKICPENYKSLARQMSRMNAKDDKSLKSERLSKKSIKSTGSSAQLLPSRSRRIFDKLFSIGKANGDNKSPDTSLSSQSPTSVVLGENKSCGSSSRHRRHSIS